MHLGIWAAAVERSCAVAQVIGFFSFFVSPNYMIVMCCRGHMIHRDDMVSFFMKPCAAEGSTSVQLTAECVLFQS